MTENGLTELMSAQTRAGFTSNRCGSSLHVGAMLGGMLSIQQATSYFFRTDEIFDAVPHARIV